jgi:Ca-activated chloride channel family protein
MVLLWPGFLILLAWIPLLVGIYLWVQRRRRKAALRYSSLALVRPALPKRSRLRRYIPPALFLLALASLIIALARPAAIVTVPTGQTTIILTMDVSGSMRFNDVPPNRLIAAETAALSFIQRQKPNTQIGVVAFSGFAETILPPTSDQDSLSSAIESLTTGRRTAIGSGILEAIEAISAVDKSVAPPVTSANPGPGPAPVPQGAYVPDIIVLLTDGVSNSGPQPLDAARQAVDRGVRVFTIGFGTAEGPKNFGTDLFGNQQQNQNNQSGGTNNFGGFRRGIDEDTLKQIAAMTGGKYYTAESASELEKVFANLPTYLITKNEAQEISVIFAALGALLAAAALVLSLLWHPLP